MISIFSKFQIPGGSERRCVELANGLVKFFDLKVNILCRENKFPEILQKDLDSRVNIITDCLNNQKYFYESNYILVVNSDSRSFTKVETWEKTIDMSKLKNKTIFFLFNFIVSPAQDLYNFEKYGIKLGIITTNKKFFKEISDKQDKFFNISHIPRFTLESPIDKDKLIMCNNENKSKFIISFLSKSYEDKWNDDIEKLILKLNSFNSSQISFIFKMMGVKKSLWDKLKNIDNVNLYKENSIPVGEFLKDSNLFIFYPSYKRQEPWARVIGEAMSCGLPIIALNNSGGTAEQIIHGNNGFLCKTLDEFVDKCVYLFTNNEKLLKMGKNSKIYSEEFSSQKICERLLNYFRNVSSI